MYRGDNVPDGCYYLTVIVWIQNSKEKYLLQQASKTKGGMFGTTGGHPVFGQSSVKGIQTEVEEELGLNISCKEFKLLKTVKTIDDFVDVYLLTKDFSTADCILQKEEVSAVKWFSLNGMREIIEKGVFNKEYVSLFPPAIRL
jgi:isopentenyldiphosphate isomerase